MALFKSLRGKRKNLPSTKKDGYAYFCTDDGTFWIDYTDENGTLQRKQLNAKEAETLVDVPAGLLKGDGTTISAAVAGTDYAAASHNHDSSYLKLSGGKLTGNLTGKYITGTWLQTTESTALGSAATKICVLDSSGWVYYRTPEQIRSDIGVPAADTPIPDSTITSTWNSVTV